MDLWPSHTSSGLPIVPCPLLAAFQTLPLDRNAQTSVKILETISVGIANADVRRQETSVTTLPPSDHLKVCVGGKSAPQRILWGRLRLSIQNLRIAQPSPDSARAQIERNRQWYLQNELYMVQTFGHAPLCRFDIVQAVEREGIPPERGWLHSAENAFEKRGCVTLRPQDSVLSYGITARTKSRLALKEETPWANKEDVVHRTWLA